jgi:large subunit ribosomal protein L10
MAISRATKTEKVKVLTRELEHSTSAIIGTFKGLTASKDFDLRKTVRAAGASYHVVKNKLAAKASQGSKIEAALQNLKGVSAVAYTSGDPVELAKALTNWVKDNAEFTFKLAIVDGKVLNVEEIGQLATMPGKEELFSKLLFLINSPAQRLATVINATGRDLAVVINQAVEKEKFSAGASAPAAPAVEVSAAPAVEASAAPAVETVSAAEPEVAPAAEPEVAAAHVEEAPTPTEQIAANPASEADAVAQPENGTASQAGEAASTEPAEG